MPKKLHKAGFVSIIGKPNVGKSTLMNAMVGERLSIITSKAQTTRHRIMGILSGEDFQVVYSDTPGTLVPKYELQQSMMRFVNASLEDDQYMLISALEGINILPVFHEILVRLPEHPAFFPKDEITDKPERFFAAEIVREKIFLNYKKEVPYSTQVVISEFHEEEKIIRMRAEIYVERKSQKGIIIGKAGAALKKVGTEARLDMEKFFQKKVFLETFVKVEQDWRKKPLKLKGFGYEQK